MKRLLLIFILGFAGSPNLLNAKDYTDANYKFSISVPSGWKANIYQEGTDKVYDFLSPDENAFIRIRSFKSDPRVTMQLLTKIYEESYLPKGSVRKAFRHQTPKTGFQYARGTYSALSNGRAFFISVYYLITREISHTVMTMVPETFAGRKEEVIGNILKSFHIPGHEVHLGNENEGKASPGQKPASGSNLFAGVGTKGRVDTDASGGISGKTVPTSQTTTGPSLQKVTDPSDIGAQTRFWSNKPLSQGAWKKMPFMSKSLLIGSMSSAGMNYRVSAAGQSTSSGYGPHILEFSEGSRDMSRIAFNFKYNGRNYYNNRANDVFSLWGKYGTTWICGRKGMIMFTGPQVKHKWVMCKTPTEETLNSICFANSRMGCAVGEHGTILMTQDGGKTWTQAPSSHVGDLVSVVFTDTLHGYILVRRTVSLKGFVLKTTDGGRHWRVTVFPSQFQTPIEMAGLSFIDNNNGWICGKFGLVFHTTNGGQTWNYVENARDAAGNKNLKDIFVTTRKEIWACGDKGTLLYSKNGGQSWEKVDLGESAGFTALEFNGPYLGYLSTAHKVYQYNDGRYIRYQGAFFKRFPSH